MVKITRMGPSPDWTLTVVGWLWIPKESIKSHEEDSFGKNLKPPPFQGISAQGVDQRGARESRRKIQPRKRERTADQSNSNGASFLRKERSEAGWEVDQLLSQEVLRVQEVGNWCGLREEEKEVCNSLWRGGKRRLAKGSLWDRAEGRGRGALRELEFEVTPIHTTGCVLCLFYIIRA